MVVIGLQVDFVAQQLGAAQIYCCSGDGCVEGALAVVGLHPEVLDEAVAQGQASGSDSGLEQTVGMDVKLGGGLVLYVQARHQEGNQVLRLEHLGLHLV